MFCEKRNGMMGRIVFHKTRLRQWLIGGVIGCLASAGVARAAQAEPVLEHIAQTGTIVAGTPNNTAPFGIVNDQGEWVGYSVDLIQLIEQRVEATLNRRLDLKLVPVTSQDWLPKVRQGDVDIVCSVTTRTPTRSVAVDFSRGYFLTGTQLLVKRGEPIVSPLLRIGYLPNTTNQHVIRTRFGVATLISVSSSQDGLYGLENGHIDAFAGDGILLEGLRHSTPDPDAFEVVPTQPLTQEVYACMVPQQNPEFKALVDQTITDLLNGVVAGQDPYGAIAQRWFGNTGMLPLNSDRIQQMFRQLLDMS
jgi:polar amino acid transport system substrate-binding protein